MDSKIDRYITQGNTQRYDQPNPGIPEPEKFAIDNQTSQILYPFNVKSYTSPITKMELKINNTTLRISNFSVWADKPIFIEYAQNVLYVWNCSYTENFIISNKGNTTMDGYILKDFNDNDRKAIQKFEYYSWNLPLSKLSNIVIRGNNNTIIFPDANIFNNQLDLKINEKNSINLPKKSYDNLKVFTTYTSINFNDSICENAHIEMEGDGSINHLLINKSADLRLVGPGYMHLTKNPFATVKEERFGQGKIVWV